MSDLHQDIEAARALAAGDAERAERIIATGTVWTVFCPCGRERHYRRPVVAVGYLNDARARIAELEAGAGS